jgi:5'-3' exonuclease
MDIPILFIDMSYYIFYRYYALCNWYKKSQDIELDIENIISNKIFIEKYHKLFIENIKKIKKKYKIKDALVILAKDCRRQNIWRHQYFEDYKKNRDEKSLRFNPEIFFYTYDKIIPDLIELDYKVLELDNTEADDIIGILKHKIRKQYEERQIYIITNDHDYLQLLDKNTHIYNLRGLNLRTKSLGEHIDLELKILTGDKSDNIPSVFNLKKPTNRVIELILDKNKLEDFFVKNEESRKLYIRNKLLIDFNMIPNDIKLNICNLIDL